MVTKLSKHSSYIIIAAALILGSVGCTADTPPIDNATGATEAPAVTNDDTTVDSASSNRQGAIILAEASFGGLNGEALWEGDTLVLSLDGDASEELEASVACSILSGFLEGSENARLNFPNGTVDCPAGD